MSVLTPKICLHPKWQASLQFVRFRKRINIQKPAPPHFERAKVLNICKPYYINPREGMSLVDLCEKPIEVLPRKAVVDNPYERILAKEVLNWFNHSRMVAFFHSNPVSSEDRFKINIMLKKQNMHLKQYGRKIVTMALGETKYEPVIQLFASRNFMVFSSELQVGKLLKLNKRMPQFILMAAIVDGQLMSKNEVVKYSNMPDLQTAQAQLVAILNSAPLQLTQNLTHHQQTLVGHLRKHIELQEKSTDEEN